MAIHMRTPTEDYFIHQHEIRRISYDSERINIHIINGGNAYVTPRLGTATPTPVDMYNVIINCIFNNSNAYIEVGSFIIHNYK